METEPLLSRALALDSDYVPVNNFNEAKEVFCTETVKLWNIAIPLVLTTLFQYLLNSSSTIYAGHLGDLELSAISLYYGVLNNLIFGLLFGMSNALGMLCGQAYGAGKVESLGVYLQRSWIVLLLTCMIILLPIYIFAAPVLKLLGQEKDIANLTGKYTLFMIPQLFSYAINLPTQKYLASQRKVMEMAWIALVALIIQNGLLFVFVYVLRWGMTGAAIASDISWWMIALGQAVYVIGWCKEGWNGFSWLAFKDLWAFAWLSFSSSIMTVLELGYSTSITLLAGLLDNAVIAIGSYSVCGNIQCWVTMFFLGINIAVSVRVSIELGMGHPRRAKYSFFVTMFQSLLIGIFVLIVILLARDYLGLIFTNSEDMQRGIARLAYLLAISLVIGSASQVLAGVAIGSGWQVTVAYVNLGCYYIFGLPLGILLCFRANLGITGLWGGTLCGNAAQILILSFIIWRFNWNKEVEQTTKRMQKWGSYNDKPIVVVV
ncbi:Protein DETOXIFICATION [Quillaja saponaria]|uniref:Protein DETOXIFICATION n=1 Tax=Quillaja saponaria TaxID=32244 RepID=A0AAD7M6E5_QUISA|nr:Protein DETOXIFICATION [Quillaja saponaria]KAJ7969902.1 Protein DETOXIFICATION [Quillaja saponaria]